jgi:hypothetical protein
VLEFVDQASKRLMITGSDQYGRTTGALGLSFNACN